MRCSTVTPGATRTRQPRGTCRFATVRMLRAASRIAARTWRGTVAAARRISAARHLDRPVEPVEPARVAQQRGVAALAHVADDRRHAPIGGGVAHALRREQRLHGAAVSRIDDPQHAAPVTPRSC